MTFLFYETHDNQPSVHGLIASGSCVFHASFVEVVSRSLRPSNGNIYADHLNLSFTMYDIHGYLANLKTYTFFTLWTNVTQCMISINILDHNLKWVCFDLIVTGTVGIVPIGSRHLSERT